VLLDDRVRVRSRAGVDLAPRLPAVAAPLAALRASLGGRPSILDAVLTLPPATDEAWPALQDATGIAVLDAPLVAGRDLTARPLRERLEHVRALGLPDGGPLRALPAFRGDARATLAQLASAGAAAAGTLLARRSASRYRPGVRCADWMLFESTPRAEMLLCGIAASGALVLGSWSPLGLVPGGATWPTRRWRALAARCRRGPAPFPPGDLWPSLGAVTWVQPEVWLAVEPDVREGSGRSGPRWRAVRVQEDLSPPAAASDGSTGPEGVA
jgi:hypothetical protein